MVLRRRAGGWSHGELAAAPGIVTIELAPGWHLGADGQSVVKGGQPPLLLPLPEGAALVPAIVPASGQAQAHGPRAARVAARSQGKTTDAADAANAANAALARFVQLRLPPGESARAWLARVQRWECVRSAQLPPTVSLP